MADRSSRPPAAKARRAGERRRDPRHPLEVTLEVRIGREMSLHATTDLSRSGAFLQHAIAFPVGTRAQVRIFLPGEAAPIDCEARVASVPDAAKVGMGLEFDGIAEKDQRRIEAFAAQVKAQQS